VGKNIRDISNQTIAGLLVVAILAVLGFVKGPFWKWTEVAIAWLWASLTATVSFELPVWGLLLILLVVTMLIAGLVRWQKQKLSAKPLADPRVSYVQIDILKQLVAIDGESIDMNLLPAPSNLRLTHALDELEDYGLVQWGYFGSRKQYSLTQKGRDFVIRHGWG
jgi:hypothetical protein